MARSKLTPEQRFWSKVNRGGPDECWEWRAARDKNGYGFFKLYPLMLKAHRVSWEYRHGPIPKGLFVLHRCDNPPCVNPAHLFLGTARDNSRDMFSKGRGITGDQSWTRQRPESVPYGQRVGTAKLRDVDIPIVRGLLSSGISQTEIGRRFGVSQRAISFIKRGVRWNHVK